MNTYEVRVRVRRNPKPREYYSKFGEFIYDEIVKTFHKDAHTPEQALRKCEKYGVPLSVQKAQVSRMIGNIENLPLEQNAYENAIDMSEFIWKRRKRVNNRIKDKQD